MKNLFYILFIAVMVTACNQEQRFFTESAEIDTLKSGIAAYEAGDWDKWRSHFADTAKVYVNSTEGMSIDDRLANLKEMTSAMASYAFNRDKMFTEMIIDDKGDKWVYYWANHDGKFAATGTELTIPVHLAVQFSEGKIVAEHIYFDATAMNAEFQAIAAASAAEAENATDN